MLSNFLNWIAKRHWWFIGFVFIIFILTEYYENVWKQMLLIHFLETLMYSTTLLLIGGLIDSFLRLVAVRSKILATLDHKHKLSQEFSLYSDWATLVSQVVRYPGRIAAVETSALFVLNTLTSDFSLAAAWPESPSASRALDLSIQHMNACLKENPDQLLTFQRCKPNLSEPADTPALPTYYLPIKYGQTLLAMLQITLKPGEQMSAEQDYIFANIGDELAYVLKAGQERNKHLEMVKSTSALAERRQVSQYLHNHLGHKLSFLHFKIDSLLNRERLSPKSVTKELEIMRGVAKESYEIVRGTLESLHPDTTPHLPNLLLEYARSFSRRTEIGINFKTNGQPAEPPLETKRALFYIFEEALNNIEKHAHASKVDLLLDWGYKTFTLTIKDDGIGFNPQQINPAQHFGLDILRERIGKVNGTLNLISSENTGTTLTVLVPIEPVFTMEEEQ